MTAYYCNGCSVWKTRHRFHADAKSHDGVRRSCKRCVAQSGMEYRLRKKIESR